MTGTYTKFGQGLLYLVLIIMRSWSSPRVIATAIGTGLGLLILIAVESLFAKDPVSFFLPRNHSPTTNNTAMYF